MANDIGGVWRTIGGRRVFIKEGQDLASAMKESGKFNSSSNKKTKKGDSVLEEFKKSDGNTKSFEKALNKISEMEYNNEINPDEYKEYISKIQKEYADKKKHTIDKNDINALNELADSGKDINDYYGLDDIAKDYIKNRRQEIGRNEFTKRADEVHKKTLDEKTRNLEDGKEIHDVFRQMDAKEMEAFAKQNPESIKKMQSYLKESKSKDNDDYEYNLYKQAKENPDSINPMTEWSTDWEDLDKRFKDRYEKENQKSDLMTAEQLKGKDREEQKEINKQYLKEQNKLAKEKGLISDYNKTDSRGSMSDDSFIEQARKNGMNDEQIAKEVYKKHNGPESNNTSDNNIKRLLAKQAKEEALAKGDKKRAESFENYEKNFAEREKRDKMGQYAYLLEKQRNRNNKSDEKPNELQNIANKVVESKASSDVMNKNIRNAYEEYKKKHPGSKINFSKFKDNYKS